MLAAGVVTIQDVLNSTGDDVMTTSEFTRVRPGLRAETYAEMLAVLPQEWRQTLRHGESEEAAARERWETTEPVLANVDGRDG